MQEELLEKGRVLSVKDGLAEVEIIKEGNCEECGAASICKMKDGSKSITVIDNIGIQPGEIIKFAIEGDTLLKTSFLLYGVPLVLLIIGIFGGMQIFKDNNQKEFLSFALAIILILIFFGVFYLFQRKEGKKEVLPKIIDRVSQ